MALHNLFKVTRTLTELLTQNITQNIDPSLTGLLDVTAVPPDKVENASNTLSLHLYHVAEDPYYKNALGPGNDVPNVAKIPMALSLFYILTAHHGTESTFDAEAQQKLMGYALKTFHDSLSSPIRPGLTARSFSTRTCAARTTTSRLSCGRSRPKTPSHSGTRRRPAPPASRLTTKCAW